MVLRSWNMLVLSCGQSSSAIYLDVPRANTCQLLRCLAAHVHDSCAMRFVEASSGTTVIHDGVTQQGQDLPSTRNAGKSPGSRRLFLEHDHGVLVFMSTLRAINNIFFWTRHVHGHYRLARHALRWFAHVSVRTSFRR